VLAEFYTVLISSVYLVFCFEAVDELKNRELSICHLIKFSELTSPFTPVYPALSFPLHLRCQSCDKKHEDTRSFLTFSRVNAEWEFGDAVAAINQLIRHVTFDNNAFYVLLKTVLGLALG